MKIVNIFGGLGNQMFQYALMLALEKRYGEDIFADTHYMDDYTRHYGIELEKIFPISLKLASKDDIKRLSYYVDTYNVHKYMRWLRIKKSATLMEILSKPYHDDVFTEKDCYYDGYWQNSKYFEDISDEVKECFKFKLPLDKRNENLKSALLSNESVGIHIRRGDYIKKKRYRGICNVEYYKNAINRINEKAKNPKFYIFSNDHTWCKENLIELLKENSYVFVDWNNGINSYKDMQLMTHAKYLILANSSFSWWAAYLNQQAKMICAPKQWFNCNPPLPILLDEWTLI